MSPPCPGNAEAAIDPAHAAAATLFADLSESERVRVLMHLSHDLSRPGEPQEIFERFVHAMRDAFAPRCFITLSTSGSGPGEYRIVRWLTQDGAEHVPPLLPTSAVGHLPQRTGGLLGRVIATDAPKLATHLTIDDDPVTGTDLTPFHAMIAVPLFADGRIIGWSILLHTDPDGFTIADLEQLILRGTLISATVNNIQIANRLNEASAWIGREVDQIAAIQRALLPQRLPDIPGLRVAAHFATFERAGGDYYDLLPLTPHADASRPRTGPPDPDERWGIMIADASGHGPAAAVMTAMLHTALHGLDFTHPGPARVLERLNQRLFARRISNSFITAFFAEYHALTRSLTYANAGHYPPLLKRAAGPGAQERGRGHTPIERLDAAGGIPLGVLNEVGSAEATVVLNLGDTILLYTDGLVEAADPDGLMFGVGALEYALANGPDDPADLVASIIEALRGHEATTRPNDDQTLLVIRTEPER